jgi:hypothetical protein
MSEESYEMSNETKPETKPDTYCLLHRVIWFDFSFYKIFLIFFFLIFHFDSQVSLINSTRRLVVVCSRTSCRSISGGLVIVVEIAVGLPRRLDNLFHAPIVFALVLLVQSRSF